VANLAEADESQTVLTVTKKGRVKKTSIAAYKRPLRKGKYGLTIKDDDEILTAAITSGDDELFLVTKKGLSIHFHESGVRTMGRLAAGVKGITLGEDDEVVGVAVLKGDDSILTVTENGYGKRTKVDEFRKTSRGTQGVTSIKTSERNGNVVGAAQVVDGDEIMMISNNGTLVRTEVEQISIISRNTQGVRLMRMIEGEILVEVERIANLDSDDGEDEEIFKLEAD
jgi:DNA gyrase subunit A